MIGRRFIMPLDRLARAVPSQHSIRFDDFSMRQHVASYQRRQKRYYDARNNVKESLLAAKSDVYVRKDVRVNKYVPYWTAPKTVTRYVAPNTVQLDNGAVRNQRDIMAVPSGASPSQVTLPVAADDQQMRETPTFSASSSSSSVSTRAADDVSKDTAGSKLRGPPPKPPLPAEPRYPRREQKTPAYLKDYVHAVTANLDPALPEI